MSTEISDQIIKQLNAEKWTRLTISNYTINNFLELDSLLNQIAEIGAEDDIIKLCEDHMQHSTNSVTALYLSGIISLSHQSIDDSNLLLLINLFSENSRMNIVKHLSMRILDFGENRHALRTLADCYSNEENTEELYSTWERLVRVDYEEADIVYKLAEDEKKRGHSDAAIAYYKKALHRYVNKKLFNQIHEIWLKLMELIPEETDFFYHAEGRVSKSIGSKKALKLLEEQYPYFRKTSNWGTAIRILKRILSCDSKNTWARNEIIECYRKLHASHSHLDEYIKLSNLSQNWRNIHDAIRDFEKHIAFDAGNFVYHQSWGVGRIKTIEDDNIVIKFIKKKDHSMSLKMAVNSLQILENNHIWVYRIIKKKEALNRKVKSDPLWALKTVIKSFGNAANMKKIKAELVPSILSLNEWTSWSLKGRNLLKTDESFGNLPDSPEVYVVRDQSMSLEEKMHNRFKAEKDFFDRVKTFQEFVEYAFDQIELIESDLFRDMFNYFIGYIENPGNYNELTISAMLLVSQVIGKFPFLNPGIPLVFQDYFNKLENYEETFQSIQNLELRKVFISVLRKQLRNWHEIYITLFPYHLHREIVQELIDSNHQDVLVQKFLKLFDSYRSNRQSYIWLVKNCLHDQWFSKIGISMEKILISMIHLLDITDRDINNKRELMLNRKLHRQIHNFLIKDGTLLAYIDQSDENGIQRIYSLLEDVKELDPEIMQEIRKAIAKSFPKFEFAVKDTELIETVYKSGFLSVMKSYEFRSKALKNLHDVEVPKNSKEIAAAREYGDLRENAEYKSAKERQEFLNTTARKWEEELLSVKIINPEDVNCDKVSFGTVVTLLNLQSGEEEIITIMGPWESNPDKKILSHLSPFALKLLNNKVGQRLEFRINQRDYNYEVKNISPADFDAVETLPVNV